MQSPKQKKPTQLTTPDQKLAIAAALFGTIGAPSIVGAFGVHDVHLAGRIAMPILGMTVTILSPYLTE